MLKNDVWTVIEREVRELLPDSEHELGTLTGEEQVHELGLNSLMLARLVVQLESTLAVDPFAQGATLAEVRSLQDLAEVYESALDDSALGDQGQRETSASVTGENEGELLRYDSIDDYLGSGDTRFFASGYRRANHYIDRIVATPADSAEPGVKTNVTVEYPSDWSKKTGEMDITPHLSSVDMIVLATQMSEIHLTHVYGLDESMRRDMRLLRMTLKAGTTPQEALNKMPATAALRETKAASNEDGAYVSVYECEVGVMKARCEIQHPIATRSTIEGHFGSTEEVLGPPASRYYGEGFKFERQFIEDVRVDMDELGSEAAVRIEPVEGEQKPEEGVEGRYQPSVSMIDSFVVSLQLAQVMIYELDSVNRRDSNTLWMLNTDLRAEKAHRPYDTGPLLARTTIEDKHLLPLNGSTWRNVDVVGDFGEIHLRCSFAHALPEGAMSVGD